MIRRTVQRAVQIWRADKHLRIGVIAALGGAAAGFALALAVRAPTVPEITTITPTPAVSVVKLKPAVKTYAPEPQAAVLAPAPAPEPCAQARSTQ
ncbi:MAG: hypothetical protein ACYYKD_09425 [Rhodospirillales bacterium]